MIDNYVVLLLNTDVETKDFEVGDFVSDFILFLIVWIGKTRLSKLYL